MPLEIFLQIISTQLRSFTNQLVFNELDAPGTCEGLVTELLFLYM